MLINGFPSKAASISGASSATPLFLSFLQTENPDMLDAAFGKNNEGEVKGVGKALAMYAWFKGDGKVEHPFTNLARCGTLEEISANNLALKEVVENANLYDLVFLSPYAKETLNKRISLYDAGTVNSSLGSMIVNDNFTNENWKVKVEADSIKFGRLLFEKYGRIYFQKPIPSLSLPYKYLRIVYTYAGQYASTPLKIWQFCQESSAWTMESPNFNSPYSVMTYTKRDTVEETFDVCFRCAYDNQNLFGIAFETTISNRYVIGGRFTKMELVLWNN